MKNTIKVRTRVNEYSNTHYFGEFEILDNLPEMGEEFKSGVVTDIDDFEIDTEQGRVDAWDYDYYIVHTEEPNPTYDDDLDPEEILVRDWAVAIHIDEEELYGDDDEE